MRKDLKDLKICAMSSAEMTTAQAADIAGVTIATIRTWCRMRAVAAIKVAGRWIITAASLARRIQIGARMTTDIPTAEQAWAKVEENKAIAREILGPNRFAASVKASRFARKYAWLGESWIHVARDIEGQRTTDADVARQVTELAERRTKLDAERAEAGV